MMSKAVTAPARCCCVRRPGTGIIAGGPMRAVFETLGIQDVVAKSLGTSNPYNMVRATFDALKSQMHPKDIAAPSAASSIPRCRIAARPDRRRRID
jgi:ribosomal protein S5